MSNIVTVNSRLTLKTSLTNKPYIELYDDGVNIAINDKRSFALIYQAMGKPSAETLEKTLVPEGPKGPWWRVQYKKRAVITGVVRRGDKGYFMDVTECCAVTDAEAFDFDIENLTVADEKAEQDTAPAKKAPAKKAPAKNAPAKKAPAKNAPTEDVTFSGASHPDEGWDFCFGNGQQCL